MTQPIDFSAALKRATQLALNQDRELRDTAQAARRTIRLALVHGTLAECAADIAVTRSYETGDSTPEVRWDSEAAWQIVDSDPAWLSPSQLVQNVGALRRAGYADIRNFGEALPQALQTHAPKMRQAALPLPGRPEGLDDVTCLESLLQGFIRALSGGRYPTNLARLTIVEPIDERRNVLARALTQFTLDQIPPGWKHEESTWPLVFYPATDTPAASVVKSPVEQVLAEQHSLTAFVAMPFSEAMKDVWYFGIQGPAYQAGFRCERLDSESYTGDVLEEIKRRIQKAHLVIADISEQNPNVLLEIGYAWGRGRDTVLLWRKEPARSKPFDMRTQKCLEYCTIHELSELLQKELKVLHEQIRGKLRAAEESLRT